MPQWVYAHCIYLNLILYFVKAAQRIVELADCFENKNGVELYNIRTEVLPYHSNR